jgi:hypothetical protein
MRKDCSFTVRKRKERKKESMRKETVRQILNKNLNMKKFYAKCHPKISDMNKK